MRASPKPAASVVIKEILCGTVFFVSSRLWVEQFQLMETDSSIFLFGASCLRGGVDSRCANL